MKTTEQNIEIHRNWFTPLCPKEKETLEITSQETKIDIIKLNVVIQWLVKI